MTTIYCDASCDSKLGICAWACTTTTKKGKLLTKAGHYPNIGSGAGEVRAAVKAVGWCNMFPGPYIIYSDFILISEMACTKEEKRFKQLWKRESAWSQLFISLKRHKKRLQICYVNRGQNPAHKYAFLELCRLRQEYRQTSISS